MPYILRCFLQIIIKENYQFFCMIVDNHNNIYESFMVIRGYLCDAVGKRRGGIFVEMAMNDSEQDNSFGRCSQVSFCQKNVSKIFTKEKCKIEAGVKTF